MTLAFFQAFRVPSESEKVQISIMIHLLDQYVEACRSERLGRFTLSNLSLSSDFKDEGILNVSWMPATCLFHGGAIRDMMIDQYF